MFWLLIALGLLSLFALIYAVRKTGNSSKPIPSPPGVFLLGNALQLDPLNPHLSLASLAKQYGGIYGLSLMGTPIVVVSDPDVMHELLVTKGKDFAGRPYKYRFHLGSDQESGVGATDYNPMLKKRRKVLHAYIKQYGSGLGRIEEILQDASSDMVKKMLQSVSGPVDANPMVYNFMCDVVGILLLGKPLSVQDRNIITKNMKLLNEIAEVGGGGEFLDMLPSLRFFGNGVYKKIVEMIEQRKQYIGDWFKKTHYDGFVHHIQTMDEAEKERNCIASDKEQRMIVWDFLIGGILTSHSSMMTLINVLAHKPDIQDKLQEELMREVGASREPTLRDRDSLPYHQATLLELTRFSSISPVGIPHKACVDTQLSGYPIRKNTEIWTNLWGMHHDEALFPEPFAFVPERFLDSSGNVVKPDHPNRKRMLAFGAGPRVCVGEVFALNRLFILLAGMMQKLRILPETTIDEQLSMDPRNMIMGTLMTMKPYKVRFQPQ